MKKYFILLLTGLTLTVRAQITDNIVRKPDTAGAAPHKGLLFSKPVPNWIPALGIVYGFSALRTKPMSTVDGYISEDLNENFPRFNTHIDDQLQFAPVASVYALGLIGVKGKNSFIDKTALYLISNSLMGLTVGTLKTKTHRLRPDGSGYRSFPSGHTGTAFVAAEFMRQEYKDVSPWYGIAAYTAATATGGLRMLNNKHWFSDVVAGAGIGILSTKLVYYGYPIIKKGLSGRKESKLMLVPAYQNGVFGFAMAGSF